MNQTDLIKKIYGNYLQKIDEARKFFDRPLT